MSKLIEQVIDYINKTNVVGSYTVVEELDMEAKKREMINNHQNKHDEAVKELQHHKNELKKLSSSPTSSDEDVDKMWHHVNKLHNAHTAIKSHKQAIESWKSL